MRCLTGTFDGTAYAIWEYASGYVECPIALRKDLAGPDLSLPTGEALEDACRVLFGESLLMKEEPDAPFDRHAG